MVDFEAHFPLMNAHRILAEFVRPFQSHGEVVLLFRTGLRLV